MKSPESKKIIVNLLINAFLRRLLAERQVKKPSEGG